MQVAGSRVGIVGGSIAGCALAIALRRLGCHVDVFERHAGALQDRGSGIAIPIPLRDELVAADYLPRGYPSCELRGRDLVLADGSPRGRVLWTQPGELAANNWGVLWRSLRSGVPDGSYHDGTSATSVVEEGDGVSVTFADGEVRPFDVVFGADGYRSAVRPAVDPASAQEYAGYVLWRGNFPESRLDESVVRPYDEDARWTTVCYDGGHGVLYPIPDFDDDATPGHRRVNWAIYDHVPGLAFEEPTSIPPGQVGDDLYAHYSALIDGIIPPALRPLFTSPQQEVSLQPIYDQTVDRYASGRIALIGDAGAVARTHTGSGATKAMQEALLIERLGADHPEWEDLLSAYNDARVDATRKLVALGRRMGRDQVERTPPWVDMSAADFEAWAQGTLSGEQLYLYGKTESG